MPNQAAILRHSCKLSGSAPAIWSVSKNKVCPQKGKFQWGKKDNYGVLVYPTIFRQTHILLLLLALRMGIFDWCPNSVLVVDIIVEWALGMLILDSSLVLRRAHLIQTITLDATRVDNFFHDVQRLQWTSSLVLAAGPNTLADGVKSSKRLELGNCYFHSLQEQPPVGGWTVHRDGSNLWVMAGMVGMVGP